MTGILMSALGNWKAAGVVSGPATYYASQYYNAAGDYTSQSVSVTSGNVWRDGEYGWVNPSDQNTIAAFTNGTPFSMVFAGITYNGTLTSNFVLNPFAPFVLYEANISWSGSAPSISTYAPPDGSFTIGGVTYEYLYPPRVSPAPAFTYNGFSASTTEVSITEKDFNNVDYWYTPSNFTLIISYTTGKQISVTYQGVSHTGTLTSGFTQPDPENFPYVWTATVTWIDSTGLQVYTDPVEIVEFT